jgi:gamma-glutamyl hercynylcysteine S-oxide synthase
MGVKDSVVAALDEARRATVELAGTVDDARLAEQHDALMSPLLWDYGHIGVYEELWLVDGVAGGPPTDRTRYHTYDAFENPRRVRAELELMGRAEVDAYRDDVRGRALDLLDEVDTGSDALEPLTRDAYVYAMVAEHEWQHQETMLQTLQLLRGGWLPEAQQARAASVGVEEDTVEVPPGRYTVGSARHAPYDNEHDAHEVDLKGFRIDRFPVSCGRYRVFVEEGGYRREELWSPAGREWLRSDRATAPKHWRRDGGIWVTERFGHTIAVHDDEPVVHVCAHEADAFARWEGRRLPSEEEWEVAAAWDPEAGRARGLPWGDPAGERAGAGRAERAGAGTGPDGTQRANLGRRLLGPAPIGSMPLGASPFGCEQMIGDVWEWTSSLFLPYPGFLAFPYPEYSQVFFGDEYRVLRGGSFATHPSVARTTFRNWDYPIRRQIFAGFRCVDGEEG